MGEKPLAGIVTISDDGWIGGPTITNIYRGPPLVGGDLPLGMSYCVSFSWGDRGFLVGRPDFVAKWNPATNGGTGCLHEIQPGIYVFSLGN